MITDTFDGRSPAIINPRVNPDAPAVDACILTFSNVIEAFVLTHYDCEHIGAMRSATGETPVYRIDYRGGKYCFFKTMIGAPACVGLIEDSFAVVRTKRYILFGGAGCLDKEIARGKIMVPTAAYRDEGTSYHYAPAADYIDIPKADAVARFMEANKLPWVAGKTWTTDAFYRETEENFRKRRAEGCISVEMECAAVQAACNFRGLELFAFFTSGDLLDAPEWDARLPERGYAGTQHDAGHFDIAIELARYVSSEA